MRPRRPGLATPAPSQRACLLDGGGSINVRQVAGNREKVTTSYVVQARSLNLAFGACRPPGA
ncbi:MAG: hypothetical protein AVDCRST_MAG88-71 [uncultured Thermomicrobiales bacterium]|uniref:Uncharacterized protein n=1 Tax=uncultured Thermomicrobiales bacterium TaxID=1645740 RepID=A0A6J4U6A3_9BACT|nr:MAG: hypothetical protein AVDCRST_MAG88-71 [uncultured Thermomicrobiales bacterium]